MIKNKIGIGTLILTMLLMSIALVPAVSATDNQANTVKENISDNFSAEVNLINNLPSDQSSLENAKKAKEMVDIITAKNQKEISDSVNNSLSNQLLTTTVSTASTVTLGKDATFTTADVGSSGTSISGVTPNSRGADYTTRYRRARETILIGPGGYGYGGAWAWVGKSIYVSGSGSRSANIRMAGRIKGEILGAAGGQTTTNVNLVVKDRTTGTSYSTPIYSQSASAVQYYAPNKSFNNGVSVTMQAGHYYYIYVSVDGSTAVYAIGGAGSDFGPWDSDDGGQGVSYSSIVVDF